MAEGDAEPLSDEDLQPMRDRHTAQREMHGSLVYEGDQWNARVLATIDSLRSQLVEAERRVAETAESYAEMAQAASAAESRVVEAERRAEDAAIPETPPTSRKQAGLSRGQLRSKLKGARYQQRRTHDQITNLTDKLAAAESEVASLRQRWEACNQLVRSAVQIAEREADHPNSTNWDGFRKRAMEELAHNPFAAAESEVASLRRVVEATIGGMIPETEDHFPVEPPEEVR